jgi:hypothetical protein
MTQPAPISETTEWATVTQASPLRIRFDGPGEPDIDVTDTLAGGLALNEKVLVLQRTSIDPKFRGRRVVVLGRLGGCHVPVGAIYTSVDPANPATIWPGTTWVAWGQGRVTVGIASAGTFAVAAGTTGGEETHTLTVAELPSHTHTIGLDVSHGSDGHMAWIKGAAVGDQPLYGSSAFGGTVTSSGSGSDGAHNNLQPWVAAYAWKRTA